MFSDLNKEINKALEEKIFSAISINVKKDGFDLLNLTKGKIFFDDDISQKATDITEDHIFDIASLTKSLCTSLIFTKILDSNPKILETNISEIFENFALSYNKEFSNITIGNLLNHSSGLSPWEALYKIAKNKSDIYMYIRNKSLDYPTNSKHVYSDLGYIMLGEILEILFSKRLDLIFSDFISNPLELKNTFFVNEDNKVGKKFVATGFSDRRNKLLLGEIHDENTSVLGGVSAHAGLFSNTKDVGIIANNVLDALEGKESIFSKKSLEKILTKSKNSDWAYGWHYPSKSSSAGNLISKNAIGITGFTGTSLWIDIERNLIITILSNRTISKESARFGWEKDKFTELRKLMHDLIIKEIK
jgi:CubicO group peptidase (beta-lactamase class C family)